uniref:ATP synthase complex subunit 8 n=1 Tax=Dryadobates olfersioides TaxID=3436082 RepID=A0A7L9CUG1_9NEOB|nr:ATP synthase F0 subunit 8 [Allobates olfersioides]
MPQLDPSPWFLILASSWLIFLIFATTKMHKHVYLNDPSNLFFTNHNKPWSWPWP